MAGPGLEFDGSEPPDGDFARYLERISASSAATPAGARHAPTAIDRDPARSTGLDACPGPGAGFGLGSAAWGRNGTGRDVADRAPLPADPPRRLATASSPVRFVDALTLAMVIGGVALIALALLPTDPWLSTPLPGFLLLVAGVHLRNRFHGKRKTPRTR